MDKAAAIDIGTNSVKFYAAQKNRDGGEAPLADEMEITRLGQGMGKTGLMTDEAMERTAAAAARFAARAREMGITPEIVGTMAMRSSANGAAFVARIRRLTGLEPRVISGEEEARLACLAVRTGPCPVEGDLTVFDTGGGSTELIYERKGEEVRRISLPLGAARVTEEFFASDPPGTEAAAGALIKLREVLKAEGVARAEGRVAGVGGAATTLASVKLRLEKYDPHAVRGTVVTLTDLEEMAGLFASMPLEERKKLRGLAPERAEIILAGTCIITALLRAWDAPSYTATDRGLRHGLVWEMLHR